MKLYKNLESAQKERQDVEALKISIKGEDFPQNLLNFPNLSELYLEGNCKNFITSVPNWEKLKILSIKWPFFKGDLSLLFSLPALENLKIIDTPIKTFLLPLGYAAAPLRSLTLKDCGLERLPEEISMLGDLQELNLSGNNLSKLPAAIVNLRKLKRLNLDQNKFTTFPDILKFLPSLVHLSIDGNNFSDEEKARIQREFHIWVS
jgi:Leucine-rich repeat (LRR) protein